MKLENNQREVTLRVTEFGGLCDFAGFIAPVFDL
jgi:hypothetical protein